VGAFRHSTSIRNFRQVVASVAVLFAMPAFAQTQAEPATREALLLSEREQKQLALEPYQPSGLQRAMNLGERKIAPLFNRDGVYAAIGSLTTGSAFSYRGGYRDRSLVRGRGSVDAWAGRSVKGYWTVELRSSFPLVPGEQLNIEGYGRRFTYPQEEFFGVGPDSDRANQATYTLSGTLGGAQLGWKAGRRLTIGGGVESFQPTVSHGEGWPPSVEEIFNRLETEGFGLGLSFLRSLAHVTYDYRQPLNARKGGYYRLDVSHFDDRKRTFHGFSRLDLDLRQYVSFLAERRILVGRVKIATTDAEDTSVVPFFLLPFLGGNDTLRGFRAYRFRGPHSILLQGEYRWEIWSAFEAALFVDAGKVAMERSDLNFKDLESDYGIGFRFNTDNGVVMRVDAAFGSKDGKHLHVVFGSLF
jgi:outer membrane protein assembly factor BamA